MRKKDRATFDYYEDNYYYRVTATLYVGNGQPDDPDEFEIVCAYDASGQEIDGDFLDRDEVFARFLENLEEHPYDD